MGPRQVVFRVAGVIRLEKTKLSGVYGFSLAHASNVLIDHCSVYWGINENIGMYQCRDVTVQWAILAEALHRSRHEKGPHSMAF